MFIAIPDGMPFDIPVHIISGCPIAVFFFAFVLIVRFRLRIDIPIVMSFDIAVAIRIDIIFGHAH